MNKIYSKINFLNRPSKKTPLNAANLNKMDEAIDGLDNRVVETNDALLVERARIDNLAKLPEGSTTGDAELIDGRVDYNGNTHTNIGTHIREVSSQLSGENAELKEDLVQLGITQIKNFVNPNNTVIGEYYRRNNGKSDTGTSVNYKRDLISIKKGATYTISHCIGIFTLICDGSGTVLSRVSEAEELIKNYTFKADVEGTLNISSKSDSENVVVNNYSNIIVKEYNTPYYLLSEDLLNGIYRNKEYPTAIRQYINRKEYVDGKAWTRKNGVLSESTGSGYYQLAPIKDLPKGNYCLSAGFFTYFTIIENLESGELVRLSELIEKQNITLEDMSISLDYPFNIYITTNPTYINIITFANNNVHDVGNSVSYSYVGDKNIVFVGKNSSYDFNTLKEAVEYSNKVNNCIIYVESGVYDLIEEFGNDYFENLIEEKQHGLFIGNGVRLFFSNTSKVVCHYTGNNPIVKKYFAPFNLLHSTSGFSIENLTLECSNVRYAIHDENINFIVPYRNTYKHCHITLDNSANDIWLNKQCIGGGLGFSGDIIIDGCYFKSVGITVPTALVSYHNTAKDKAKSLITIKNSYFSEFGTFRAGYAGVSTEITKIMLNNNSLGANPIKGSEGGNIDNMEIIAWNNEIRS